MVSSVLIILTFVYVTHSSPLINTTASCSTSACISVTNNCGTPLYLQRTTIDGPEGVPTSVTTLASGSNTVLDISGWNGKGGQRLYAWWKNPVGASPPLNGVTYRDKVEINWCKTSPNTMCYNPTAVDYFGLPVHIGPENQSDCPSIPITGSGSVKVGSISSSCPTKFTSTPPLGVCESPGAYCSATPSGAICNILNTTLAQCVKDGNCQTGVTTTQAYGCSSWFSQEPEWCAAINRGVYSTQANGGNQNDPSKFYLTQPYNVYAKWIHTNLAKEYAFPYDDYQGDDASGYNSCTTNFMGVTFCPSG